MNERIIVDLDLLQKEIDHNSITYLSDLYEIYHSDLWKYVYTYLYKNDTLTIRKIIRMIINHNCLNLLEFSKQYVDEYGYEDEYTLHWLLILMEAFSVTNHIVKDLCTKNLKLDLGFMYAKDVDMIIDIILKKGTPEFLILFLNHCNSLDERDSYICCRGKLLRYITIWDEDNNSDTPDEYKEKFCDKWFNSQPFVSYINNMIKEVQQFELIFSETFLQYTAKKQQMELDAHARSVIAELCLPQVPSDIIKFILKQYL